MQPKTTPFAESMTSISGAALPGQDEAEAAMAAVLAEIAEDASGEPARYLRDTIVPEGGE